MANMSNDCAGRTSAVTGIIAISNEPVTEAAFRTDLTGR